MIRRIRNVIRKEWTAIAATPSSLLFVVAIPLMLIIQALFLVWLLPRFISPDVVSLFVEGEGELQGTDMFRLLLLSQFRFFVLLIPAMVANVFATLSIVEEKLTRTLEPLLATPVRTWELLTGKAISGVVPALLITWASAGLFVVGASALGWAELLRHALDATWFLSLFVLTPAVSVLSFVLGIIGSSRASDAKSAQNLAVLVVFPIFALIAVQVTGLVRFTPLLTILLSIGITAVDVLLLWVAVRLFARESILIRWR
ncbi:ABC transporter permease subunit [Candidatus Bipolaricaulota bacterium]|nr:ABC transporter permease subunit [Candidatus Bipolaricaulota bacterium]